MKKNLFYAFAGAIALSGAVGFSSCSSSEDTADVSPNFNSETNEVVTQFVFNVSTGNQATTRQSSAATQATTTETFRGITNAALFTYKLANDGKHIAAATTADKFIDLGSPIASSTIDANSSHRVLEMSLPINTNTMLFYGKAPEGTASSGEIQKGYSAYDVYGHLDDYTLAGGTGDNAGKDISAANFELGKRMTADNKTKYDEIKKLLGGVLTCIINTKIADGDHVALDAEHYGVAVAANEYPDVVTWADYANANGTSPVETTHELYALEVKLAEVYKALTTIQTAQGELRAGYGTAILHTIEDVWSVINSIQCATPFSKGEAVAQKLAELIHEEISLYFNGTVPTTGANKGGAVTDVNFRTVSTMVSTFNADGLWPTATAGTHPTVGNGIGSEDLSKFPMAYAVPSGAAHYDWDGTKKIFEYVTNYSTASVGNAGGFTVESYLYPAELLYFGNSPLRVSGTEHKEPTYPNGVGDWMDNTKWSEDWVNNSHVVSTTRSVAMRNNINYGSALLKTTIGYKTLTLKDNNHKIQKAKDPSISDTDEPNKEIAVSATSFQLVGLVIGGQYKKVGWDFIPKTSDNTQGYIYDKAIPEGGEGIPGTVNTPSNPNYTLVFDNYKAGEYPQDIVYVALELKNNSGQDFYGKHNLIRNGDSFYLVGKLDPANYTSAEIPVPFPWSSLVQASNDHPLPPYNTDGTSKETVRVFMQDFMTTANFWFGEQSLQEALLTVPDLRHNSLTLGLSVDMSWSTGITFSDVILGQ
jgi:hypothetical protein